MDDATSTITLDGAGAFLGFAKGFNGGELDGTNSPAGSITYEVIDYAKSGDKETITVAVDIAGDGTAWWTMRLTTP